MWPRRGKRAGTSLMAASGFTLIELLVIMVIIGVTTAVAAPLIADSNLNRSDLTPSVLQVAQTLAARTGAPVEVAWNSESGRAFVFVGGILRDSSIMDAAERAGVSMMLGADLPMGWWSIHLSATGTAMLRSLGSGEKPVSPGLDPWTGLPWRR